MTIEPTVKPVVFLAQVRQLREEAPISDPCAELHVEIVRQIVYQRPRLGPLEISEGQVGLCEAQAGKDGIVVDLLLISQEIAAEFERQRTLHPLDIRDGMAIFRQRADEIPPRLRRLAAQVVCLVREPPDTVLSGTCEC